MSLQVTVVLQFEEKIPHEISHLMVLYKSCQYVQNLEIWVFITWQSLYEPVFFEKKTG